MEEWRDIEGFPGYQVSSLGRVRSLHYRQREKTTGSYKILESNSVSTSGYYTVVLCNNPIKKRKTIHRLVASAFIPNINNKEMVDHINTDKTDNNVSNLRWATRSENCLNHTRATLSSEHYITQVAKPFRVNVPNYKQKAFKTLEEAIAYRNSLI